VHPHAEQAAEAAEAAAAQGAFWPMHDTLFENQDALELADLLRYAAALGIDDERFERELTERRYAGRVREHFMSGVRSGVNGTPAFFINGVRHDGSYDVQSLYAAINDAV
jgi:protein-disulfide isomerase